MRGLVALALVPAVFAATAALAQAPVPAPPELQTAEELLGRAKVEFQSAEPSRALPLLDELVGLVEALRRQAPLPTRGLDILVEGYELRARAYYTLGQQEKAAESFRSLVQVRPQHALDRQEVSPKVVEFFGGIKKKMVGQLAVTSRPPGARVSLAGEVLGITDFFPVDVLAGEYAVEIAREGYRTETRTVTIAPRATETLEVELVRTHATAFFVTEPPDVEIWIDGQLRATTGGALAPEHVEIAQQGGLDPLRSSARTEVAGLSLGPHTIEFRRPCYQAAQRSIDVPEPMDFNAEPIRMEPSVARLTLTSDPPGARILLDGEARGQTPRTIEGICSGRHRLEVRHERGRYLQELTLAKDQHVSLEVRPRPTLAYLGVAAEVPAGERVAAEAGDRLAAQLARVASVNVLPVAREALLPLLDAEKATLATLAREGDEADLVRRVGERLGRELEVHGLLVGLLPDDRLQRHVTVRLLAAGNATAESWRTAWADPDGFAPVLSALEQKVRLVRPWAGFVTVDTAMHEGVPVLRVAAGGPAARAGLRPGDVVTAAEGRAVTRTAELRAAVAAKAPGDRVALHVRDAAGASRTVEVELGESPQEVPLNDPALVYNKLMMDLRQEIEARPGTEAAGLARLNLALAALHFGDAAGAHAHLVTARSELPPREGVSQGTVAYYLAVALERLGYRREAAEAYRAAAQDPGATLFDNDGPKVTVIAAPRAARAQ